MYYSEAEKVFQDEVREKKKAALGVHSKTGSRGYVGKMRFPSDIMSRKDKYNYRRAGKVMTSNLYEDILPIKEFEQLEIHEQKNRLQYWRNTYSNKEILAKMKIGNAYFYKLISKLDLPKASRVERTKPNKSKRTATATAITAPKKTLLEYAAIEPQEKEIKALPEITPPKPIQEIMINGLHLIFNGTYSAEEIIRRLTKFELMLDGETDPFYIELKLVQKPKEKEKENILFN